MRGRDVGNAFNLLFLGLFLLIKYLIYIARFIDSTVK